MSGSQTTPTADFNSVWTLPWHFAYACTYVRHGCFITLAAWTKSCKLKFFRTVWQPHSNALPQYFRLSNKLLPHQARDFWHVVDTSSWNYCPQGGVGRKPGENRCFSGQVTSSRVTVVLDRVLGPLWTKEKFCERWKTVICGASGFYSVAHVKRSYLEFFGESYSSRHLRESM